MTDREKDEHIFIDMSKITINYPDKRASIEARVADIPIVYTRLEELLNRMGFDTNEPDTVLYAMFDANALTALKTAQFDAYANNIGMPQELREHTLEKMLALIPEEVKDSFRDIRRSFADCVQGWELKPTDIRYHYRKFQLTEEKRLELLASTEYTLTDEEQKDAEMMTEVVKNLRKLRDHNDFWAYLHQFVASRMTPEQDRSLDELARVVHEHRCLSKGEIEKRDTELAEKAKRDAEEYEAELQAERERARIEQKKLERSGIETPTNIEKSFIARIKEIQAHHKANASKHDYGSHEPTITTDDQADRVREIIDNFPGHGEVIFVK